ncbi:ribosome biogenesis GTPase YlqF [bacterium]|nr:ribosome biogenesis GTPase YlqF [bacterium]
MAENKSTTIKSEHDLSERINWFPGHMTKALREVKQKIKKVDILVEIRDARIPQASGNPSISEIAQNKPRLIVLNKSNLADMESCKRWESWFLKAEQTAIFINALKPSSVKKITTMSRRLLQDKWQKYKDKGINTPPIRMLVVGIPNTGKSTVINRLTKRNAAKTGDRPGVTRHQEWIVLDKDIELLDTPGIMPPRIDTMQQGMWLCAIHAIKDEIVGKEKVATFLVDFLISRNSSELKKRYRLDCLDHNAEELILQIGHRLNYKKHKGIVDYYKTCNQVLLDFRKGLLGNCSFEEPPV